MISYPMYGVVQIPSMQLRYGGFGYKEIRVREA